MYKVRLRKAAAFTKTIDPNSFIMTVFSGSWACGFVGCAMGHMAHAKVFRGLVMRNAIIAYKGQFGMDAVRELFGLKRSETYYLFGPSWEIYDRALPDVTPKNVARRIERFIANPEIARVGQLLHLDEY